MKISKNIVIIGSAIIVVAIGILIWFLLGTGGAPAVSSVSIQTGNITEKVNLSGSVKASQGVDLSFEAPGKIVANYVKVGDKIYAGQALLAVDSSILQSQLKQAQAQLDTLNIDVIKSKTDVSLQSTYANSISAAQKSVTTAKGVMLTISDLQFSHFSDQIPENNPLFTAKEKAVSSLLGQPGAGNWTTQSIAQLHGGAYGAVQDAIYSQMPSSIDSALSATQTALQDVSGAINAVPINNLLNSADRTALNNLASAINQEIITTSANIQAIASLKVNNSATVTTTNAQIEAAQANINTIKTQISKTVIFAPFSGQVDKDNAVVGALASVGTPVVTISNKNLEVDTYIPEIDFSQAKVGGNANITLDAYGNGTVFPATIFSIDTAPTIVGGVTVYGAKLKFNAEDSRIKPGMTANITLISETHSNVLLAPISAVIQRNGTYFVVIDKGNGLHETRQITTGIKDDKNIEILSGLASGEKVFAY